MRIDVSDWRFCLQRSLFPLSLTTDTCIFFSLFHTINLDQVYHGDSLPLAIYNTLQQYNPAVSVFAILVIHDHIVKILVQRNLTDHVRVTHESGQLIGGWESGWQDPWNDSKPLPDPTAAPFGPFSCPAGIQSTPPLLDSYVIDSLPGDSDFRRRLKATVLDEFDPETYRQRTQPVAYDISGRTHLVYPIGFGVPASEIKGNVPTKRDFLAHILPGNTDTYLFRPGPDSPEAELLYRLNYSRSYFGVTMKKVRFTEKQYHGNRWQSPRPFDRRPVLCDENLAV